MTTSTLHDNNENDDGIEAPQSQAPRRHRDATARLRCRPAAAGEDPERGRQALDAGYRHIDAVAAQPSEGEVGAALAASGLPRQAYFVSAELPPTGELDAAVAAFEASLERLGLDHVDLYLLRSGAESAEQLVETWQVCESIHGEEAARTIGVAGFGVEELDLLERETATRPTVNRVELHPRLQQAELRGLHAARGIATGSWSPLTPNEADDDAVARLARSNAKTTSQVVLRWQLQLGNVVTAQPLTDEGAREDIDVFDFELSHRELAAIADLGRNRQMLLR